MDIAVHKDSKRLIIALSGELDHHTADLVRDIADRYLKDSQVKELLLDMEGVPFMDSSGIGVLLGRYKQIAQRNGIMRVINVRPQVYRILKLIGIEEKMDVRKWGDPA